ncbi:unnamed protein product [Peniophora sp. CBMAI 1063]|nr:unnamed protein product [Peniophora sp. CBMAI 1063]
MAVPPSPSRSSLEYDPPHGQNGVGIDAHAHADAASSEVHPQSDDPISAIKLEQRQHDDGPFRPPLSTSDSLFDTMTPADVDIKPLEPKFEPESATVKFEDEGEEEKPIATPTPTESKSATPAPKAGPQLIGHLPRAENDALSTFEQIRDNWYQYNTLGRSREALEGMNCDCIYEPGVDDPSVACGDGSDCINRLTQVECIPEDCRCRKHCQNQRFQRKQYANIEIVKTELKGFGLRAGQVIPKDAFIYEYVGDVVSTPSFSKRMRQYANEGIKHFYFMMLQKDEFIDATKRGGIGRFANHSCAPNCYVAKWTVGERVRMGIFAKRRIQKDEELTFNYNVDRYGHEAQTCYCGEPNCVGFIGGKTQTDVAGMDDLYLDALGLTEEVERLGLKGNKKKKGKKLDEDWSPDLKALTSKECPKIVQAIRQTQSKKVMLRLLGRIQMSDDLAVFRELMRLRGFSLMTNLMNDYKEDDEVLLLALQCMAKWPLLSRNKIDDSKISEPVENCTQSENERLKNTAQALLDAWALLEAAYRIPKRQSSAADAALDAYAPANLFGSTFDERPAKKAKRDPSEDDVPLLNIKPLGFSGAASGKATASSVVSTPPPPTEPLVKRPSRAEAANVIAAAIAAQKAEEERKEKERVEALAKAEEKAARRKERKEKEKERREKKEKSRKAAKEKGKAKAKDKEGVDAREKKLLKLVGAQVVKVMSKYKDRMPVETFKKHAKELTHLIAEKEKKSASYKENRLDSLSDEKVAKIKKFAKEYIHKVVHRLEKNKRASSSNTPSASGSASTLAGTTSAQSLPEAAAAASPSDGKEKGEEEMAMTVEEAMGMSEDEAEAEDDDEDEDGNADADADGDADSDEEMHDAPGEKNIDTPNEPAEPATPDALTAVWTSDQGVKGHDAIAVVDQGEPMVLQ